MPFIGLHFVIGHLEKRFPESIICGRVWLSCCTKIFCANYKNVSSVFSLADCALEPIPDSGKLDLGLVSAGSWLCTIHRQEGDNLSITFQTVCSLFHVKSCRLLDCEKSSILLTIHVVI